MVRFPMIAVILLSYMCPCVGIVWREVAAPYIIIYGRREIYWIIVTFPKTLEFQLSGVDDHDETVKY